MSASKTFSPSEVRPEADRPLMEWAPIAHVRPNPKNPRTHSKKQIKQIAASIRKFGFLNPRIVDDENTILAGHGRLEAARLEGLAHVPIVRSGQLSEAQKRAYLLADNKIALNAEWDEELLAIELKELMSVDEFSVELTGFSIAEVDQLIDSLAPEEPGDPADDEAADSGEARSRCRLGDIWRLGPHRLICGD